MNLKVEILLNLNKMIKFWLKIILQILTCAPHPSWISFFLCENPFFQLHETQYWWGQAVSDFTKWAHVSKYLIWVGRSKMPKKIWRHIWMLSKGKSAYRWHFHNRPPTYQPHLVNVVCERPPSRSDPSQWWSNCVFIRTEGECISFIFFSFSFFLFHWRHNAEPVATACVRRLAFGLLWEIAEREISWDCMKKLL